MVLIKIILWSMLFGANVVWAETATEHSNDQNNPAIGQIYEIVEPDLVEQMQAAMRAIEKKGEFARLQKEAVERTQRSIEHPIGVPLPRTEADISYTFDPSISLGENVTTPDGKLLGMAGQRVNPLDYTALTKWMIFFDADDSAQVRHIQKWIKDASGNVTLIAVNGEWLTIQKSLKRQVFFDQAGIMATRLNLTAVPARVKQENKLLRIDIEKVEQ